MWKDVEHMQPHTHRESLPRRYEGPSDKDRKVRKVEYEKNSIRSIQYINDAYVSVMVEFRATFIYLENFQVQVLVLHFVKLIKSKRLVVGLLEKRPPADLRNGKECRLDFNIYNSSKFFFSIYSSDFIYSTYLCTVRLDFEQRAL